MPSSSGRIQSVRLFNDSQAVYHEDQSVYHDQAVYYERGKAGYPPEQPATEMDMVGGKEEEHQTEHHWADDNFGHFSQEEQPQYEEEEPQYEPPYDYLQGVYASQENKSAGTEDEIPMTTCTTEIIQKTLTKKPFLVLLDSGAHGSWWNAK